MTSERVDSPTRRAPRHHIGEYILRANQTESTPFNFEIDLTLLDDRQDMTDRIPATTNIILRWLSDHHNKCRNVYGDESDRIYDILRSVKIAEYHLAKLPQLGIEVPKHAHIAIGKDARRSDAVALYTTVEKLELTSWDQVDDDFISERVFNPIKAYGAWLIESKQQYMMMDIGWQMQYGLVAGAAGAFDVYLLDIEPVVGKVTPESLHFLLYEANIGLA